MPNTSPMPELILNGLSEEKLRAANFALHPLRSQSDLFRGVLINYTPMLVLASFGVGFLLGRKVEFRSGYHA